MNEIPKAASSVAQIKPTQSVSSVGANGKKNPGLDTLTPQPEKAPHAVKDIQEHVEAAVAQMNEYIQSTQRDLHFSYDKASGETVVKVLDRSTQEVIRQIPDETFLKLAHTKDVDGNFQLFSAQA